MRQKATTISLGLLVLLFSPVSVALFLFQFLYAFVLYAFAVIVLCPETRVRRVAVGNDGCVGCESYACPILVAVFIFGLPILFAIAKFVGRRARSRTRSLPDKSIPHHS